MDRLLHSPALERLEWILDGLDGNHSWGDDADVVLAPELTAVVPAEVVVERTRLRSPTYVPVVVIGVDVDENTAKARIRNHDGSTDVVTCMVEPQSPHRITNTWVTGPVPGNLTPRLPMDFTDYPIAGSSGRQLIVFSGLPSSGKSTLVDAVGQALQFRGCAYAAICASWAFSSREGGVGLPLRAPAPDRRVGV